MFDALETFIIFDVVSPIGFWLWQHSRVEALLEVIAIVWAIRGMYLFVNRYLLRRR